MKKLAYKIMETLNKQGFEAYLVGGCTRDLLLEQEPHDYDIATNATDDFLTNNLGAVNISGNLSLGVYNLGSVEIARYRTESGYNGRVPSKVNLGVSLEDDAHRRDFTMNSIYLDKDDNIVDLFNGTEDIKMNLVKCVGNPEERFSEDYLRMLRACRFAATLGDFWEIETQTLYAIQRNAYKITDISSERIVKEFEKASNYDGNTFLRFIVNLQNTNLLTYILPEIINLSYLTQNPTHHPEGNVFVHTMLSLGNLSKEGTDFKTLMSILFHDCGKASCHEIIKHTYHGHAEEAEPIIQRVAERLKLSNDVKECMLFCAKNHMKMHKIQEMRKGKVIELMKSPYFDNLMRVYECDELSRVSPFNKYMCEEVIENTKATKRYIEGLKSHIVDDGKGNRKVNLAINGHDVLQHFEEGAKVGKVLRYLEQGVLDGAFDNEREYLLLKVSELKDSNKIEEME